LRGALPAVYLAALAEASQVFVMGRTPDGTDLLVAVGAVLIGWVITRRAGFEPAPRVLV
jgi:VanZ family protein